MRSCWRGTFVLVALSCAIGATVASAQDVRPARAGDGPGALPALVRVPVAGTMATGLVVAGHAGYGLTEGLLGNEDTHHRLSGALAASVRPLGWLGIALRLNGHLDEHSGALGTDSGLIGEARLAARASTDLSPQFGLGLETVLFVPGQNAPSLDFGATTLDASALLSWSPSPALALATTVGVRIDQSGNSVPERDRLTRADRLSLGVSDSHALLLGLGASLSFTSVELVAEVTADLLFGDRAPPLGQSPLRIAAGARIPLVEGLALSILAEGTLSARPALAAGDALVPVEPRISLLVGLVWHAVGRASVPAADTEGTEARPTVTPPPPPRVAPAGPRGRVTGLVYDDARAPLAGATVRVEDTEPSVQATTDATGAYTLEGVPVGRELRLRIVAPGRSDSFITVIANADAPTDAGDVELAPALPAGVIRGMVRSLRGRGRALAGARIAVTPGAHATQTDERGEFEIEVPPGAYEVVIQAEEHESQQRQVTVEQLGVIVLNVDLRRSR